MSWFQRMNRKIDEGWKMTTMTCDCKGTLLIMLENRNLYCPKCDIITQDQVILDQDNQEHNSNPVQSGSESKPVVIDKHGDFDSDDFNFDDQTEEFQNRLFMNRTQADEASKKIGQLLLQGWAMLNESCIECLQPIMKSKQGVRLCVQCNREEKPDKPQVKSEQKQQVQQQQIQEFQPVENSQKTQKITEVTQSNVTIEKREQQIQPQKQQIKVQKKQVQAKDSNLMKQEASEILQKQMTLYYQELLAEINEVHFKQITMLIKEINKFEKQQGKILKENQEIINFRFQVLQELTKKHEEVLSQKKYKKAFELMDAIVMIHNIIQRQ